MTGRAEKAAVASRAERIAMASRAEMYRCEARECVEDAGKAANLSAKDGLLELARRWCELADQIEQMPSPAERWWPGVTEIKGRLEHHENTSNKAAIQSVFSD